MFKSTKHLIASLAIGVLVAPAAWADTISWATIANGGASGVIAAPSAGANAVTMTLTSPSPLNGGGPNWINWMPTNVWADGTIVANAPVTANSIVVLNGGSTGTNTLKFSEAVVNPVMAIYSLGGSNTYASFVFDQTPTFVVGGAAGGGGKAITVSGKTVSGSGVWGDSGTIQFIGTFTQLTWTNPQSESWYGFDVGIVNPAAAAVPEPASGALLLVGLLSAGFLSRRRRSA